MREQLRERRRALRERLGTSELTRKRRRHRRLITLALLILALLLLQLCSCEEWPESCRGGPGGAALLPTPTPSASPTPTPSPTPSPTPKPKKRKRKRKPKAKTTPPPIEGDLRSKKRGEYLADLDAPPPWLTAFRLQVAARSTRMATCFEGSEGPGALRWTSSVDAKRGTVSDHAFETMLGGAELSKKRRSCLTSVLESPVYRLGENSGRGSPLRVTIVIEF